MASLQPFVLILSNASANFSSEIFATGESTFANALHLRAGREPLDMLMLDLACH